MELNKNGLNKCIYATILSDAEMRKIGFTDLSKDDWYYCRLVKLPHTGFEISFDVTIPKDGSEIRIDVLDEDFLQPYDYQLILERCKGFEPAVFVNDFVENEMLKLELAGVLHGHIKGEYI